MQKGPNKTFLKYGPLSDHFLSSDKCTDCIHRIHVSVRGKKTKDKTILYFILSNNEIRPNSAS